VVLPGRDRVLLPAMRTFEPSHPQRRGQAPRARNRTENDAFRYGGRFGVLAPGECPGGLAGLYTIMAFPGIPWVVAVDMCCLVVWEAPSSRAHPAIPEVWAGPDGAERGRNGTSRSRRVEWVLPDGSERVQTLPTLRVGEPGTALTSPCGSKKGRYRGSNRNGLAGCGEAVRVCRGQMMRLRA
jgi:hypothetical protein